MSIWFKGRLRSADPSSSKNNAVKILDEIFRPNSSSGINNNDKQIQDSRQFQPVRTGQILRSRYSSPNKQSFNKMIFSSQKTSDNSMNSTFCKTSASSSVMDSKSLRKMARNGQQLQILEQQHDEQKQHYQEQIQPYLAIQEVQLKKPKKKLKRRVLSAQKTMQLALQFTPYLSRANTAKNGSRQEQKTSSGWVTPNHQKIAAISTTTTARYNSSEINNNNTNRKSRQTERQQMDDVNRWIRFDMSADSKGKSRRISSNDIIEIENHSQMQIEDQGINNSSSSSNNINIHDIKNYVSNSNIDYSQDMQSNRLNSKSKSYQFSSDNSQKILSNDINKQNSVQINRNTGLGYDNITPKDNKKITKLQQSTSRSPKGKMNLDLSNVKSQQPWNLQQQSPNWGQSSATLRFSSESHSFSKAERFGNDTKHSQNKLIIDLPSTLKNRSASFGFGKKTDIFPQKHIERAQVTPSPQSHNILRFPEDNCPILLDGNSKGHISPGKTFGISFESYRRNFIKHAEKTVYAPEVQADHPGPDAYDVREKIGRDKLHFSILKRLPMFNEVGFDKQIPTSTRYSLNEKLVVNKRFEGITFGIGERIDLAKPANDYPGPIYDLISQFRPQSSQ